MLLPDFRSPAVYERIAPITPWLDRITAAVDGVDPVAERRRLVDWLDLSPGHRVLEVAIGTGANLPFLDAALSARGSVVGIDAADAMLRTCHERWRTLDCRTDLVEAEAARLPLRSNAFDAVLHFGGINAFPDRAGAIAEMSRVARPDATVVISDKSLPPDQPRSLRQRLLVAVEPRLARPPPVELVPLSGDDVELTWFWGGAAFILSFTNPG